MKLVRQTREKSTGNWSAAFMGERRALTLNQRSGKTTMSVYAGSDAEATKLADVLASLGEEHEGDDIDRFFCSFVYRGERRVVRTTQEIAAPVWAGIVDNYEQKAGRGLGKLMELERPERGRLVMLHGPAGTGKTTAVRSLVREWASWCDASYILDPEELFSRNDYLNELVVGESGKSGRWQLFIVEDADEVVTGEGRASRHLARLLNLTDGLLGSELKVIFLITTNESLTKLHPALARPGRCLAEIKIDELSADQARKWLAGHDSDVVVQGAQTLADLYAAVGSIRQITGSEDIAAGTGLYL
jgi:hypothetical protein